MTSLRTRTKRRKRSIIIIPSTEAPSSRARSCSSPSHSIVRSRFGRTNERTNERRTPHQHHRHQRTNAADYSAVYNIERPANDIRRIERERRLIALSERAFLLNDTYALIYSSISIHILCVYIYKPLFLTTQHNNQEIPRYLISYRVRALAVVPPSIHRFELRDDALLLALSGT